MKLYVICDTPRCVSATISVCILNIPDLGLNMFAIGVKVQPKCGWLDSVYKLDAWVDKYLMNRNKSFEKRGSSFGRILRFFVLGNEFFQQVVEKLNNIDNIQTCSDIQ